MYSHFISIFVSLGCDPWLRTARTPSPVLLLDGSDEAGEKLLLCLQGPSEGRLLILHRGPAGQILEGTPSQTGEMLLPLLHFKSWCSDQ